MENFYSVDEITKRIKGSMPFAEFLRIPAMSCGVYMLRPGEQDRQRSHNQDEIYYVVHGTARMRVTAANHSPEDRPISAGDVIFVAAHDEHRFHNITESLVLLVVFAPAYDHVADRN
jgi:mannose-6-phosphate isomerase-like protein (cupin superfamily)